MDILVKKTMNIPSDFHDEVMTGNYIIVKKGDLLCDVNDTLIEYAEEYPNSLKILD